METTRKVNAPHFFLALFVAQATAALAFNAQYAGGPHFLDNLLSCLLARAPWPQLSKGEALVQDMPGSRERGQ